MKSVVVNLDTDPVERWDYFGSPEDALITTLIQNAGRSMHISNSVVREEYRKKIKPASTELGKACQMCHCGNLTAYREDE